MSYEELSKKDRQVKFFEIIFHAESKYENHWIQNRQDYLKINLILNTNIFFIVTNNYFYICL